MITRSKFNDCNFCICSKPLNIVIPQYLLKVEIREGLNTNPIVARDEVTLYPVKSGDNALTVALSNSNHTFPASDLGVVSSYAGSGTTITVLEGSQQLQFETGTGFQRINGRGK